MTLTIHNVNQGTPEWLERRRGILTASTIGRFITPKTIKVAANDTTRSMAYQLVAERITGVVEDHYISRDMEAGHFIEPIARNYYSEHHAPVTEVGFITNNIAGHRVGYSPDGLVGDDGLIEVKLHLPKLHLAIIINDHVPAEHMAQCQMGLLITGRKWLDYVAYCPGWPVFTRRIFLHPEWTAAITEAVTLFEESAGNMLVNYQRHTAGLPLTERIDMYEEMVIA